MHRVMNHSASVKEGVALTAALPPWRAVTIVTAVALIGRNPQFLTVSSIFGRIKRKTTYTAHPIGLF